MRKTVGAVAVAFVLVSCSSGGSGGGDSECNYNSKGDWDCVIERSCFPGSDGKGWEHVKLQSDNSWHPTGANC
jgi:hypothetical protein